MIYLLLFFTVLYIANTPKPANKNEKKDALEIDLTTLAQPKRKEQKLTKKPKQKKPFEAYNEKVNEEKGKSDKEVKDDKKAPSKPVKKQAELKQKPIQQKMPQKIKTAKIKKQTQNSKFPSFDEIGTALEAQQQTKEKEKMQTNQNRILKELYGSKFESLGKAQKKFLTTNIKSIQSITQRELNYMGYPQVAIRTRQNGANLVEFYLYPNGDISDLKLIKDSGVNSLDAHTIELIKRAYKDYPYPQEKTLVRIKVLYNAF